MNCNFHEILETINLAKLYIENLNSLKTEIYSVEKQVETTFKETEQNIKETFCNLKKYLFKKLENRENELLKKAQKIKDEGLQPLKQCETIIKRNIQSTLTLIDEGEQMSQNHPEKIINFLEKANILGNLPEVPESKEVPYISFYHEPTSENQLESLCSCFGEVFRTAPIQVKSVTPKPGSIFIEWQQSYDNDDRIKDIQEFKLQRTFGDVFKERNLAVNFIDCYTGTDTQYLLRDIQILQPYSFRVCCKFDGSTEWSPWSVPQVGSTSIRWFSWKQAEGVALTNDDKIVTLTSDAKNTEKVVLSNGPLVALDDSVEFTILEADSKSEMILAIISTEEISKVENLGDIKENAFIIDSNGKISIAGNEKSTFLPPFTRGLKVCFSLEPINSNKIRVSVDSKDKRVTYDWSIGDSSHLFFACQMMTSKWKVMVE